MSRKEKDSDTAQQMAANRGLFGRLRGYFIAGVLVTAPIGITAALAWWFIDYVDQRIVPLIPSHYNPDTYLSEYFGAEVGVPGLGLVILVVTITLIGALTAGLLGRWIVGFGEKILHRMPIIRSLYKTTKQIIETVFKDQGAAFRQAVLIEYPRRDAWTIAFITADAQGELVDKLGQDYVGVYVPTTPNPTSGFLLWVPKADVKVLDMTVEEAVKYFISVGIVPPGEEGTPLNGVIPRRKEPLPDMPPAPDPKFQPGLNSKIDQRKG